MSVIKNNDNVELFKTIQLSSQELIKLKGNDVFMIIQKMQIVL